GGGAGGRSPAGVRAAGGAGAGLARHRRLRAEGLRAGGRAACPIGGGARGGARGAAGAGAERADARRLLRPGGAGLDLVGESSRVTTYEELELAVRARLPLIAVVTPEEARAEERLLKPLAAAWREGRLFAWSLTNGYVTL